MKLMSAVALVLVAAPAVAQPAPTATMPMASPMVAAKFGVDTPIETLAADAKAKAVLMADLPDVLPHPAYETFKAMSLRQVQPYSNGMITDELLAKVAADLAAIK